MSVTASLSALIVALGAGLALLSMLAVVRAWPFSTRELSGWLPMCLFVHAQAVGVFFASIWLGELVGGQRWKAYRLERERLGALHAVVAVEIPEERWG